MARYAERERMLRRTKRVMVALSGGPDSVACLLVLLRLCKRFDFEVVAGHFDHQLRTSSGADLQRVRSICDELGVECVTGEGDVRSMARDTRQSIELAARTMRYQFLAFAAGKEMADAIATGHTSDDQAETVLLGLARGSGARS
ncbi:MAG: tRNA lysidine(34) synthetase TilS, partial [Anaerolineaceae bacterium]